MRSMKGLLLLTSLMSGAAWAGMDKPAIGPAPDWVKPVAVPAKPDKADEVPVRVLLADQQSKLEAGRMTTYANLALYIQTPQGLAAGNLSFPWDPETDDITVHKLVIHRDGKDIDVLAGGQTFTVVRREPNLESATLDGRLTANIQPEGLQVGDVLEYAVTMSQSDPVLKGHVEQSGANWNGVPFSRAHMSVQWPSNLPVTIRQDGALPVLKPVKSGGITKVELSLDNVEPIIPPSGAPVRFAMGRIVEFSDFKSWADLGALMAPLYAKAAIIPAEGSLRTELEKIKAASDDPVKRTEAALALVQDRVRYVALLMGVGGLTPAKAEETWSRRYGDCKAKSALLLALLGELGIDAEPVAANAFAGDGMDARLPMVGLFNHVLVRARIGGRSYWLDGTRSGDISLARLQTPYFNWGLPLVAQNAALVKMVPDPLDRPENDLSIEIDAHAGLSVPAPFKASRIFRGDDAVSTKLSLAGMTADARDRALRDYWRNQFKFLDVTKVNATFDAQSGEETMSVEGNANMEWKDGWYETDGTGVGFDADFVRTPGPGADVPFTMGYPSFERTVETIKLPPGFTDAKDIESAAVNETVAGIEYRRHAGITGSVFHIEQTMRTIAPEFAAKDAPAAQKRLRDLADKRVYIRRPDGYRQTNEELAAALKTTPSSASAFIDRAFSLSSRGRFPEALADLDRAIALEPSNAVALSNRGVVNATLAHIDAAKKDLNAAFAIDPRNKITFHGLGMVAANDGDFKAAAEAFSQAITIDPKDLFAINQRANVNYTLKNYDAALADIDAALKLSPKATQLYLLRATIFRTQGKNDDARAAGAALEQAIPDDSFAHVVAARIYDAVGQKDEAMKAFDRALAIRSDAYVYVNRAEVRAKTDIAGRTADYDAALKLQPNMAEATDGKARMFVEQRNFAGAIKLYSDALAGKPGDTGLLSARAFAYAKSGDAKHAEQDFKAVREKISRSDELNNLCYAKATSNIALESALADCDAALSKDPDVPAFLDSRAFVLLRLGRLDEAIATFDRVLAKAPNMSPSLFGRAVALSRKGEQSKAQADRDAAIKANPNVQKQFENFGVAMAPAASNP